MSDVKQDFLSAQWPSLPGEGQCLGSSLAIKLLGEEALRVKLKLTPFPLSICTRTIAPESCAEACGACNVTEVRCTACVGICCFTRCSLGYESPFVSHSCLCLHHPQPCCRATLVVWQGPVDLQHVLVSWLWQRGSSLIWVVPGVLLLPTWGSSSERVTFVTSGWVFPLSWLPQIQYCTVV